MELPLYRDHTLKSFSCQDSEFLPVEKKAFRWRVKHLFYDAFVFFWETPAKVAGLAAMGFTLLIIVPPFSVPFFSITICILTTRLVVKLENLYNVSIIHQIKIKIVYISNKYKRIEVVAFVISLLITYLSPPLAIIPAVFAGLSTGIHIEKDHIKKLQKISRTNDSSTLILSAF